MANSRKNAAADADPLYARFVATASGLPEGARVTVALSGGLDSTVLLDLLRRRHAERPLGLAAFHFQHGLNPRAEDWLVHCRDLCRRLDIPFSCAHGRLDLQSGGVEAAARDARYRALARLDCSHIALAHHRDDQAETVLYRLLRGAGPHGAAAMAAARPFGAGRSLWRPLLGESRAALADYADRHGLVWIEDDSNLSIDYDRNYLRHRVMPTLTARFPAAAATLARDAGHFAEAALLLDEMAAADAKLLPECDGEPRPRLSLASFAPLSPSRRRNLLRWFLAAQIAERPDTDRLNELLRQLLGARPDATVAVRIGAWIAHCYRGDLYLERDFDAAPAPSPAWRQGETLTPAGWPGCLAWRREEGGVADAWLDGLEMRPRRGGERLRLYRDGPTRPLKLLLQEAGIPPWRRLAWPLLWRGDTLVAIPGIGVAAECRAEGESGWQPIWRWET